MVDPKAVNRQVAKAIIGGIKELLSSLREPGSPARQNLLQRDRAASPRSWAPRPNIGARIEEVKLRLLEDAEAQAWLARGLGRHQARLLADLASPQSRMPSGAVAAAIHSLGRHLLTDPAMRAAGQSYDRSDGDGGRSLARANGAIHHRGGAAMGYHAALPNASSWSSVVTCNTSASPGRWSAVWSDASSTCCRRLWSKRE